MFQRYAAERLEKLEKKLQFDENGLVLNKNIDELVDNTQKIVEGMMFSIREYNLKLDDVINSQRNVIYTLRDRVLEAENLSTMLFDMVKSAVKNEIDRLVPNNGVGEKHDWRKSLEQSLRQLLGNNELVISEKMVSDYEINEYVTPFLEAHFEKAQPVIELPEVITYLRNMMIFVIDRYWTDHLDAMTMLKEGIGFRQYQQEDPMRIYEREGFGIFQETYKNIEKAIAIQFATNLPQLTGERKE